MFGPLGHRRKPKPRLPSTGEGHPIEPKPSPAYEAKKAALEDEQVRLSLDLAEEAVVSEPDNWTHRKRVGEVIWDTSEPGIALAFAEDDGQIVWLTFIDTYVA